MCWKHSCVSAHQPWWWKQTGFAENANGPCEQIVNSRQQTVAYLIRSFEWLSPGFRSKVVPPPPGGTTRWYPLWQIKSDFMGFLQFFLQKYRFFTFSIHIGHENSIGRSFRAVEVNFDSFLCIFHQIYGKWRKIYENHQKSIELPPKSSQNH